MDHEPLLSIFLKAVFIENMALAFFLGMCSFLALSKKIDTAFGLGTAVVFVLALTTPLNYLILHYLTRKGALTWISASLGNLDLRFLNFMIYIAVIASTVQLVELILDRFFPPLYNALGIFLPLITVNCSILGASLFMEQREYDLPQSAVYGVGAGIGFLLAIVALAGVRKKLRYSNVPPGLRGMGITFICTGLMALGFLVFSGVNFKLFSAPKATTAAAAHPAASSTHP
jgi:Na+-transporting NADH:ubiquinone oxidoreductase subunit E